MKLSATYPLPAPPEKAFTALTDPDVLQACIPGCEQLTRSAPDTYDARLKIGVAGLKGTYSGTARMTDLQPPVSYTLEVNGRGAPGFVKGRAAIHLTDSAGVTELSCDADVQVGGLIAAVGSRLIEAAARKTMDDFFRCLAARLLNASPPGPAQP